MTNRKSSLIPSIPAIAMVVALASSFGLSPAALADDAATPVETTPAPVTKTATAVRPKGEAALKSFLDEVMQNKTEMKQMAPLLRVNLGQQTGMIPALSTRLQSLGTITAMSYVGLQKGMEIYDVRFTNGAMVWGVVAEQDGQISVIRWKFH